MGAASLTGLSMWHLYRKQICRRSHAPFLPTRNGRKRSQPGRLGTVDNCCLGRRYPLGPVADSKNRLSDQKASNVKLMSKSRRRSKILRLDTSIPDMTEPRTLSCSARTAGRSVGELDTGSDDEDVSEAKYRSGNPPGYVPIYQQLSL